MAQFPTAATSPAIGRMLFALWAHERHDVESWDDCVAIAHAVVQPMQVIPSFTELDDSIAFLAGTVKMLDKTKAADWQLRRILGEYREARQEG